MAFNYYEGWTEADLLTLRREVQQQLHAGRVTEIRLAGESTRTDARDAASLEQTLQRIAYALSLIDSEKYPNPNNVITIQSHY
jgi:hypothetical protein